MITKIKDNEGNNIGSVGLDTEILVNMVSEILFLISKEDVPT